MSQCRVDRDVKLRGRGEVAGVGEDDSLSFLEAAFDLTHNRVSQGRRSSSLSRGHVGIELVMPEAKKGRIYYNLLPES